MKLKDIIIKNACLITGDGRVFGSGCVHASGGFVEHVGDEADIRLAAKGKAHVIDAGGRYVLPGFINPHMHFYGLFARGMPVPRMRSLGRVLEGLWWDLDKRLSRDDVFISAIAGGVEAVKAGVTTVFDHHASYGAVSGSLRTIAKALGAAGIRASLSYEISDRAGKRKRDEAIAESGGFLDEIRSSSFPGSKVRSMVGLHASMTLSDGTLDAARELMDIYGAGAHVHVAEGQEDVRTTQKLNGMTPVERLFRAGILRRGSLAVHCVHVGKRDINLLRKSKAAVVHNPLSNFNNAVGTAPVPAFFRRGVPVAIGTDGMSAGVGCDIRTASVIHRASLRDAQALGEEFRGSVWETAPEIASAQFGVRIGTISKGAAADMIISDASPQTEVTPHNAWWHTLFGVLTAPVRTTIIAGSIRMRDFKIVGIDEAAVAREARVLSAALWKRRSV
ncbi:MAG TPA: amidohydrolase family protein [bacterium]|nr:amidohydrolase family protein [bacterium]